MIFIRCWAVAINMLISLHGHIFPYYWPFLRGTHLPPMDSIKKGQLCEALKFSFLLSWITYWANSLVVGDSIRHDAHDAHGSSRSLLWRQNDSDNVSNHQPHKRLFKRRSKKTPKLRVTGLCEGKSPVTGEFPAQKASNAENVSIWWRHHVLKRSHHCRRGVNLFWGFPKPSEVSMDNILKKVCDTTFFYGKKLSKQYTCSS